MAAKIQDADCKSSSEVTSDSRLINDNKIYVSSLAKRLDQAISAGDIGPLSSPTDAINYTLSASVSSNALTIALKTKAGTDPSSSDPVKISIRSATASSGSYDVLTITSALSITVSSGSTLGHASGTKHPIWVYLFNDSGTPRMGVGTTLKDPTRVRSTVAEGGAGGADSNAGVYTSTAIASKPFTILGKMVSTQTTAGTWASVPSDIDLKPVLMDKIFMHRSNGSGTALSGSDATNVLTYPTLEYDTVNAWDTTNHRYICPLAGTWSVTIYTVVSSISTGVRSICALRKNGTNVVRTAAVGRSTSSTDLNNHVGTATIKIDNEGDYMDFTFLYNEATSRNLEANSQVNYLMIRFEGYNL